MRRPTPTQFVLFCVVAALLVFWWSGRRHPRTQQEGPHEPVFPEKDVVALELQQPRSGARLAVAWEKGEPWIVEPYRDRADPKFLAQSLRVAATLRPLRVLPDTDDPGFGLEPAQAIWRCRWDGGELTIALGDTLPAGGGVYAQWSRDPRVLVVDGFLARRYLAPPWTDLHDPVPARLEIGPIDSIHVVTRDQDLDIVRLEANRWRIRTPLDVEGFALNIDKAVEALRRETLKEVLGPVAKRDLPALGLAPSRATWTLVQAGRAVSVAIGQPTPDAKGVYAIPGGRAVVAILPADHFRLWVDGIARLRDPRLLDLAPEQVHRLTVADGRRARSFQRGRDSVFQELGEDGERSVDGAALERAVANLCVTQALGFHPSSPNLGQRLRVILESTGGQIDTLTFRYRSGPAAWVETRRQPGSCEIAPSLVTLWRTWLEDPPRGQGGSETPH